MSLKTRKPIVVIRRFFAGKYDCNVPFGVNAVNATGIILGVVGLLAYHINPYTLAEFDLEVFAITLIIAGVLSEGLAILTERYSEVINPDE